MKLDDLDDALTPGDAATARARRLLLALEEAPHTLPLADLDALLELAALEVVRAEVKLAASLARMEFIEALTTRPRRRLDG